MINTVKQLWRWSSGDFERKIEMEGALEAYGSFVAIECLPKMYLNTWRGALTRYRAVLLARANSGGQAELLKAQMQDQLSWMTDYVPVFLEAWNDRIKIPGSEEIRLCGISDFVSVSEASSGRPE